MSSTTDGSNATMANGNAHSANSGTWSAIRSGSGESGGSASPSPSLLQLGGQDRSMSVRLKPDAYEPMLNRLSEAWRTQGTSPASAGYGRRNDEAGRQHGVSPVRWSAHRGP